MMPRPCVTARNHVRIEELFLCQGARRRPLPSVPPSRDWSGGALIRLDNGGSQWDAQGQPRCVCNEVGAKPPQDPGSLRRSAEVRRVDIQPVG